MVVDHLSLQSDSRVACIYLNHKETDTQTPSNLLAGVWRQIILGIDIPAPIERLYLQHVEKRTTPTLDEIHEVLRLTIAAWSRVYIVVDAVDEYPETHRRTLFKQLRTLGSTVTLMITSRSHIPPSPSLPNVKTLAIRAQNQDIAAYIDAQIETSPRLSKHVQMLTELREEIHSKITGLVDGMYVP